jgi:16S rRNA (cytosine1402-N4)-methyltransferase
MVNENQHIPVLLEETINALAIKEEEFYIDATFGLGGYSKAILEQNNCKVLAIDRDPEAIQIAQQLKERYRNRFFFY